MSAAQQAPHPGEGQEENDPVRLDGAQLEPEEMAALTAVLAQMRAQGATAVPQAGRHGRMRRPDRTLLRRGDLGLWARPGQDQWRRAAGWR
ncbi:hypothetical protein E4A47_04105 [Micrococcus flavus]|uniref:Uncharacterized protein n=1 Tax=Micrococcus flavus TaxID=384602 RepID=A0A4Y8X2E5_9MICC|nr:acyl-CoA carboxylase epsilon subunit [Micrococcus flavus]MBB4883257.1 hypothetical protein [Micrococcus flavus]TFI03744.1 hypothetical protein E4A47_04105 [Micrococcus flavus]GGK43647.1 hypothetical protein GCM10007073_08350 [Micrococcus flavus]